MRTKNLFRSLIAATLAVVSMSAFAQLTTTGAATAVKNGPGPAPANANQTQVVDFATVGSVMPYNVVPDTNVASMVDNINFLVSEYNWRVDTDPTTTVSVSPAATDHANRRVRAIDGTSLLTNATTPNYYTNYEIAVNWLTAGEYDITVSEQSRNTLGLPQCPGSDSTLRVYVMPRPSVEWNETAFLGPQGTPGDRNVGGCAIAVPGSTTSWAIPVLLESYTQDVKIAYSYTKYTMSGTAGTPVNQTLAASINYNEGTDSWYTASPGSPNSGTVTLLTLIVPDPLVDAAGAYGRWEFTITGVNDMVSRKSGVTNTVTDLPGDIAGQTFTLWSLPTPTTGTIRHVTNVGW